MILQALVKHYEDLAAQGKLDRPGWSRIGISYALYIQDNGELEQVVSVKNEEERGKKKALVPQSMSLPAPVKRSSGIASNFCGTIPAIFWAWTRRESLSGAWSASPPAKRCTTNF